MDTELTCPVCQDVYARDIREPVLLPGCGHAFCRTCLRKCERTGKVDCPTCRKPHIGIPVSRLPTVYALLSLSEKYKRLFVDEVPCSNHGSPLEFWCRPCQEALCGDCLLVGHLRDGHVVERGKVFVAEKKQEIVTSITQLVKDIAVKKDLIIKEIAGLISNIALDTEESQVLHDSQIEAEKLLSDISNVTCIESALTSLVLVDSLQTRTEKIALSRTKTTDSSTCDKCLSSKEADQTCTSSMMETSVSLEEVTDESREGMNTEPQSPMERDAPESFRGHVSEITERSSAELTTSLVVTGNEGECSSVPGLSTDMGGSASAIMARTKAPWPLHCCVIGSDGRKGRLKWENEKLHMYSLTRNHIDAQVMIQLSVVEWLISAESPEVFLDLGSEHHQLGRVYLRLYGQLRRAQHFLALCLGSLGPSYKYSKFHGVAKRGSPGETLAGGKYITSENNLSIQGLFPGLEWGAQHTSEKRAGLVVGASGRKPAEEAFFHICTKDHVGRKFACVFGEVVSGMHVLREAVHHMLHYDVLIRDVGVVLSHGM